MKIKLDEFKEEIINLAFEPKTKQRQIEKLIEDYFIHLPIPNMEVDFSFLARCRYNAPGEVFSHVDQLSYNPNPNKIGLQRCNYKRQQVFYAAAPTKSDEWSMTSTAILEACMEYIKGEDATFHYLTLSRWKVNRPLMLFMLPYSEKSFSKNADFKNAKENFDIIIEKYSNSTNDMERHYKDSLEFISDVFCERENKDFYYRISSAYFNFIMNSALARGISVDGLVYPSANTDGEGINIVLRKELVDTKIVYYDNAIMFKAQRDPNKKKEFVFTVASSLAEIGNGGTLNFKSIW